MNADLVDTVTVATGDYSLLIGTQPPHLLDRYLAHAQLAEDFPDADNRSSVGYSFVAVGTGDWPQLVVTQHFSPAGFGFGPGVLLVPEAPALFIGAGTRILAYHRDQAGAWRRTLADEAEMGFWAWRQHGDVVVMSAELELAAWSTDGTKLWTTFVEPPWSYRIEGDQVQLKVMDTAATFDKHAGPAGGQR